MRYFRIMVFMLLAGVLLAACSSGGGSPAVVASLTVSPTSADIAVGASEQFTAVAKDASGQVLKTNVSWNSSATDVATIDSSGLGTGKASGSSDITASAGGVTSNTAVLTVSSSGGGTSVASVTVSPASPSIAEGATQQFTAVAKDSGGNALSGVTFTWASSATDVATVDSSGLAKGVAAGSSTISASAGGESGSATLSVIGQGNGDFGISAAPSAPSVAQGGSSSVTVLVSRYASNVGNVQLSISGKLPSGLTSSFSPNPETGTGSTLTLTAAAGTPLGSYDLFIQGKSSSDTETTALSVTVTAPHDTLLVDDDGSDNNSGYNSTLSASDSTFRTLLDGAGIGYDTAVVATEKNGPTFAEMKDYSTVIWYTGDQYGGSSNVATLSSADEINLKAFLDQGDKRLIAFSNEYLYALSNTNWTSSTDTFLTDYIGAVGGKFDVDNHRAFTASGVSATVTAGDSLSVAQDSPIASYNSPVNPASGTDTLLTFVADPDNSGTARAVPLLTAKKDAGTAGSSKVIFATFSFENVVDVGSQSKATLLSQLLGY